MNSTGRPRGDLARERDHEHVVDAGLGEQQAATVDVGQGERGVLGPEHRHRVRVEGGRDDAEPVAVGQLAGPLHDVAVAEVHAVEVADDDDRATEVGGHVVQGTPDTHEPRLARAGAGSDRRPSPKAARRSFTDPGRVAEDSSTSAARSTSRGQRAPERPAVAPPRRRRAPATWQIEADVAEDRRRAQRGVEPWFGESRAGAIGVPRRRPLAARSLILAEWPRTRRRAQRGVRAEVSERQSSERSAPVAEGRSRRADAPAWTKLVHGLNAPHLMGTLSFCAMR